MCKLFVCVNIIITNKKIENGYLELVKADIIIDLLG